VTVDRNLPFQRDLSRFSVAVIVLAAGSGSRLGSEDPKALVPVGGVPMVTRAVRA